MSIVSCTCAFVYVRVCMCYAHFILFCLAFSSGVVCMYMRTNSGTPLNPASCSFLFVGCGKTTFLDLLTGRRKTGTISVRMCVELCISSSGIAREMEQRPLDSSTLELCISSSGIAREMEQRPLDSSTLELCISSSGIAREMEQRPLDSSTLELCISSSGMLKHIQCR